MKVLHLEDNDRDAELIRRVLEREFAPCAIAVVDSRERFLAELAPGSTPDLILSDFALPQFDGLTALRLARQHAPGVPFVFASGSIGEERAILSIRSGAFDYVLKDDLARLPVVIRHALADAEQRRHHLEDDRRLRELAGIIERSAEAIVVSDLAGRITLWNHGAALLYGIPGTEAVGAVVDDLLPATMRAPLQAAGAAVRGTGAWRGEFATTTRDGRNVVVDLRMTLVRDEAGEPSGRLIIATDITDKRHLEEQFLRAQRLESLGLLAAGIAHDLNNVLAPVLMSAPILRLHVTAPSALRVLDILEKSAERGTGLVRQILGFSQGASTGLRLIQVKHLLRDLCAVVHASFPKSIALDDHVPADLWPVQGNPTQIHQVLLNLAINARDAMLPRGGTLRLAASNQTLDAAAAHAIEGARPGAFLVLEVGDTGTGIPPELLTRIWDPFFTTKGEGQGTGLGLATVRGIVASHHGFVTLTTRVDHGTTFRVFLPAEKPADPKGPAPADPELPRGHGELLLLVDDETDVRDIAGAILRDHGYRVLPACDGVDAIGLFTERATEIQLVITDVNMPHVDGHALASVLRRLRPELKIMAISGLGRTGNDSAAPFESAHFDTRLQKPFTVEDLLTTVHRTLHREPPAGPRLLETPAN